MGRASRWLTAVAITCAALLGIDASAAHTTPRTMARAWMLSETTGVLGPVTTSTSAIITFGSVTRALALSSGHTIWSVDEANGRKPLYLSSPAIVRSNVVVPFDDNSSGGKFTFDAANGHATKTGPVSGHFFGTPVVRSGLVAATTADLSGSTATATMAFAKRNWLVYSGPPSFGLGEPTIGGGRAYVWFSQEEFSVQLEGFDPAQPCSSSPCAPSWTAQLGGVASRPSTSNGSRIAVSTSFNGIAVFNGATGAIAWSGVPDKEWLGGTTSALGKVFVGANNSTLRVYYEQGCGHPTCTPVWTAATPGTVVRPPVVAGGHVFVATTTGDVAEYSAAGCGKRVCAPIAVGQSGTGNDVNSSSPPVVSGGLLITTFGKHVIAFKIV